MNTNVKKPSGMVQTFLMDNVMLFVFLAFFVCGLLFVDKFASIYNMKNYLKNCAPLLIASTGLTFVVLNGGIDFSITSVISFGSVIAAYLMVDSPLAGSPLCVPLTILIVLAIGVVFGCINGLAVSRLKMPSFVATLAMQLIGSGIAVWFGSVLFDGVVSLGGLPESFRAIGGKGAFWLPVLIAGLCFLFCDWLNRKTVFGRQLYAIGVNPHTAEISGVPVRKNLFYLFLISGLCAGLASVMYTAKNGAGVPTLGDKLFIDVVGSVVIGGTNPAGGFGSVKNTLYGVLFLTLVSNILNLLGIEWFYVDLIKGLLVIAAAVLNLALKKIGVRTRA